MSPLSHHQLLGRGASISVPCLFKHTSSSWAAGKVTPCQGLPASFILWSSSGLLRFNLFSYLGTTPTQSAVPASAPLEPSVPGPTLDLDLHVTDVWTSAQVPSPSPCHHLCHLPTVTLRRQRPEKACIGPETNRESDRSCARYHQEVQSGSQPCRLHSKGRGQLRCQSWMKV